MPLRKIPPTEPIPVKRGVSLYYTWPGWGKTTFGMTTRDALFFDFDDSAKRTHHRFHEVVPAWQGWEEVRVLGDKEATREGAVGLADSDFVGYRTAVVDTTGRGLDKLTSYIGRKNPALLTSAGNLTQNGWGALAGAFKIWIDKILDSGLDVVLLCHHAEDRLPDDSSFYRPDIQGKMYREIWKLSDSVAFGYKDRDTNRRLLDFNTTKSYVGKNIIGATEPIEVPDVNDPKNHLFCAGLVDRTRQALGKVSEAASENAQVVANYRDAIEGSEDLDYLNEVLAILTSQDASSGFSVLALSSIKSILHKRALSIGLIYDRDENRYTVAAIEAGDTNGGEHGPPPPPPNGKPVPRPAAPSEKGRAQPVREVPSWVTEIGNQIAEGAEVSEEDQERYRAWFAEVEGEREEREAREELQDLGKLEEGDPVEFLTKDGEARFGLVREVDLLGKTVLILEDGKTRAVRYPLELGRVTPLPKES